MTRTFGRFASCSAALAAVASVAFTGTFAVVPALYLQVARALLRSSSGGSGSMPPRRLEAGGLPA